MSIQVLIVLMAHREQSPKSACVYGQDNWSRQVVIGN